jgi:hypothetical protein
MSTHRGKTIDYSDLAVPVMTCRICDKDRDPLDVPDKACGHHYDNRRTVMVPVVPLAVVQEIVDGVRISGHQLNGEALANWIERRWPFVRRSDAAL